MVKTEAAKGSLYFQGPSCFNELPRDIRSIKSVVLFKSWVKEHFLSQKNFNTEDNISRLYVIAFSFFFYFKRALINNSNIAEKATLYKEIPYYCIIICRKSRELTKKKLVFA